MLLWVANSWAPMPRSGSRIPRCRRLTSSPAECLGRSLRGGATLPFLGCIDQHRRDIPTMAAKGGKVKKQGYYDREDESIGMRLGKGKATKKDPKKAKAERDMSYGKWGKRSKDWKKS